MVVVLVAIRVESQNGKYIKNRQNHSTTQFKEGNDFEGGLKGKACSLPESSASLGKPSRGKSEVFLNIVQKAFDPPLLFEHLSYFAGGVF